MGYRVYKFISVSRIYAKSIYLIKMTLSIYTIDAVGSWQIILPMPNLERAY